MAIYEPAEDSYLLQHVLRKQVSLLLEKNPFLRVLEIGPGSGILLEECRDAGVRELSAVEKDSLAAKHCQKLGFKCANKDFQTFFSSKDQKYDLIYCNPPYLPEDKREPIDSRHATTGGKKGGEWTNKFLKETRSHLTKNGRIYLLLSSLTKGVEWEGWKRKKLAEKKLFFEKLTVYELIPC